MENTARITCPKCGNPIDVSSVLRHQLETEMKKDFEKENEKYSAEIERLKQETEEVRKHISEEKEKEFSDKIKKEREKLRQEAAAAAAAWLPDYCPAGRQSSHKRSPAG
jgi:hypothetical protein